jgi:hypothetical protein
MRRSGLVKLLLATGCLGVGLGAAPATPSYQPVERAIDEIKQSWAKPGAPAQPNAPGWNAFFDAMQAEFHKCGAASSENDRLVSLNRLYKMWVALEVTPWASGQTLRDELRTWLRPRVQLAWAERRLVNSVRGLNSPASLTAQQNRDRWLRFVDNDLGQALRQYDGASTVGQRLDALDRVYRALDALQQKNATYSWLPSLTLQTALNDLYNHPNLDISVDVPSLAPYLEANVVQNGPIYRKGYVSQVTAGPKSGFGLLTSDSGIAFYNSQWMTSVTPITDFQRQIASDRQGRQAAKMYQFDATSTDSANLTIVAVLTPSGLQLGPQYQHNVDAMIGSVPQPGRNLIRGLAALFGYNQARITNEVYSNAIPKIRQNVVQEAAELGAEKTSQEAAIRNVSFSKYLIGYDRLAFRNLLIEGLSMRSRPDRALLGGTLHWRNARDQIGAEMPQPSWLEVPAPGVSADLHLSSILTNLTRGYLQSEAVNGIENVMLVTRKVTPEALPRDGVEVVQNADFPSFLAAVTKAQEANDPKVLAVRVKRPARSPDFAADARGFLVASIHDFQIDVPAPPQAARGGMAGPPAHVYRITSPRAEVALSFKLTPAAQTNPVRLSGKIEEFDPGPGSKVYAINEDETKAQPLTNFTSAFVLGILRSRVQGQLVDVPLSNLQLQGFAIREVSPLDPTGWIRAQLVRTSPSPAAGIR